MLIADLSRGIFALNSTPEGASKPFAPIQMVQHMLNFVHNDILKARAAGLCSLSHSLSLHSTRERGWVKE